MISCSGIELAISLTFILYLVLSSRILTLYFVARRIFVA